MVSRVSHKHVNPQDQNFGGKLHHEVPSWVDPGAVFHIRIRCESENPAPLTIPSLAAVLLDSVRFYETRQLWHVTIFLLMPDHLHALLSFPRDKNMGRIVGDWKRFHAVKSGVKWQKNYFDHRLRDEHQAEYKYQYILNNPVAKGFCSTPEEWPWKWSAST